MQNPVPRRLVIRKIEYSILVFLFKEFPTFFVQAEWLFTPPQKGEMVCFVLSFGKLAKEWEKERWTSCAKPSTSVESRLHFFSPSVKSPVKILQPAPLEKSQQPQIWADFGQAGHSVSFWVWNVLRVKKQTCCEEIRTPWRRVKKTAHLFHLL